MPPVVVAELGIGLVIAYLTCSTRSLVEGSRYLCPPGVQFIITFIDFLKINYKDM